MLKMKKEEIHQNAATIERKAKAPSVVHSKKL